MNKHSKIFTLFLSLFLLTGSYNLHAQAVVHGDYQQKDSVAYVQDIDGTSFLKPIGQQELFKPHVNVSLGSSFSSFGQGNNAFGTYIAPEISMPVSKKFSVTFGMGYANMFYNSTVESGFGSTNRSYGNLFVSGTYQVNEKLIIRGTAYKTFLLNPAPTSTIKPLNPQFIDFSSQGVIFDAEYKISERFKVGVSIEYREQNYPSFYDYNRNGINSFGGSPFRRSSFVPGF
jgi:hypothetical protein